MYEAIGSPTIFWNNSPRSNWLFLKFVFGSSWKNLADRELSAVARSMRVLLVLFVAGFVTLLVLFVRKFQI
jgi:hypothetical protein